MEKYLALIAEGLYRITCSRYSEELREAKFIIAIMIQAARDLHTVKSTRFEKDMAFNYLNSDAFLYHCHLVALDDKVTREILVREPRPTKRFNLPDDRA